MIIWTDKCGVQETAVDNKKPGREEPAKQSERSRKYKGRTPREAITEAKKTSPCKKEGSTISVALNQG